MDSVFITVINAMIAVTAMTAVTNGIVVCSYDFSLKYMTGLYYHLIEDILLMCYSRFLRILR